MRFVSCKGHNYHVFTLGASKCSICGCDRYPPVTPKKK